MAYKIGTVSRVTGVSVRALRHYDEVGLLRPSSRSAAGYRLYTDADLERLQQVLFFRELGFGLEDIGRALADPSFDRRSTLVEHRARLVENATKAAALVRLVDRTLRSIEEGVTMKPEEMFEGFDPSQYEDEARARWGKSEAFAESKRRTSAYGPDEWASIREESDAITAALAGLKAAGVPPTDARATALAEQHRKHIDRWFYPCSPRIHRGLGEMYVADARFAAVYEKILAGLTEYICEAFRANAERES
jgi:MerR family transcriptional regulator, thiopeptide resistance regulator